MDDFTRAYIECALWSSNDESRPDGGDPLYENYGVEDLAPSALAAMQADCDVFQAAHGEAIDAADVRTSDPKRSQAGHDFWLTRNGHGAGFWDGDWPEPLATTLTAASKAFGECDLYVGDDGLVYVSGRESEVCTLCKGKGEIKKRAVAGFTLRRSYGMRPCPKCRGKK